MIVSCEKDKLNNLVQNALRAVSARVTMPILSGILFNAEGDRLIASATDLEMSIRAEVQAGIEESGSTVVSGRLVGDIIKSLPAGEVKIETGEKFMTVKTPAGEYRIREMMPEDFPQIPGWEGQAVFKAGGGNFVAAVQRAARASSSDEKRPVLTGTLVEKIPGETKIRLVATDSYRLAFTDMEVSGSVEDWSDAIVPSKTLNEVARLCGGVEGDVEIRMQEKQAVFRTGDMVVSSRLIEGQFPNYKQLLPKGEKTGVKVPKEDLLSVVKRALVFGHNLKLAVYGDHLRIATETPEVGESKEEMPAAVEGEEMEIGFNGHYLLDGLAGVDSETVEIRMDDPQKPAVIRGDESEKYNYILMPVRLR